jgi:hypothetical protein
MKTINTTALTEKQLITNLTSTQKTRILSANTHNTFEYAFYSYELTGYGAVIKTRLSREPKHTKKEIKIEVETLAKMITDYNTFKSKLSELELDRAASDINGNPRYLIYYLDFADLLNIDLEPFPFREKFEVVIKHANYVLSGSKYRGKDFGGGIVFQSYNTSGDLSNAYFNYRADYGKGLK